METAKNKGFKNKKDQNKFSPMEKGSKDWQIGVHRPWKNFWKMSEMKKIPSFGGFKGQNSTEKNVSWSTKFGNMTAKMAL